jgi:hypothetical protein
MSLPKFAASSFTDDIGATISIPAERIGLYAIVKSEQAAVLSRFVADYTAGFNIDLTESEVSIFASVVGDLAAASKAATSGLSEAIEAMQEGVQK